MPQRQGTQGGYQDYLSTSGLGKVMAPEHAALRRGVDSLPGRSLGGLPPLWNILHQNPGITPGSTYWEDQAYRNELLAARMRAQQQPPQTGYGGTTPGSVPVEGPSPGDFGIAPPDYSGIPQEGPPAPLDPMILQWILAQGQRR